MERTLTEDLSLVPIEFTEETWDVPDTLPVEVTLGGYALTGLAGGDELAAAARQTVPKGNPDGPFNSRVKPRGPAIRNTLREFPLI